MNKDTWIEKYFQNKLSASELENFQELIKTDSAFKTEFEFQKNIKLAFRNENRAALKKEFQKIDFSEKKSWKATFLIAASFALVFAIGSYFYTSNKVSNQQLFAQNFEPYPNVMHPVVRGGENSTEIEKAFVYYENQDYYLFIEALEKNPFTKPDYTFYLANAYLVKNNTTKAIVLLEKYLAYSTIQYKADAHWYLGLALIKNKEYTEAKKHLQEVINLHHFNTEKAKIIITILK